MVHAECYNGRPVFRSLCSLEVITFPLEMYEHPQEHFQAETDEKIRMVQPHHEKWTFLLYILKKSATSGMICRDSSLAM